MTEEKPQHPSQELVEPSSKLLARTAEAVLTEEIASTEIQRLIDNMLKVAEGEQGDSRHKTMVGLAAPQVGVSKRVILVATGSTGAGEQVSLKAYINPVVIKNSTQTEEGREGCYSTGNVCGIVERSKQVTIQAYNRKGNRITETHEGFPARIFQHEIDHLEGIRFPDRITDDSKLHWVEPEEFGEYRKKWAEWKTLCPRKKWQSIKDG